MRALFKCLKDEAIANFRQIDLVNDLTPKAAILKTQLNLCSMLYDLPDFIKHLEEQLEQQKEQKAKFVAAQESGNVAAMPSSAERRAN